ncbi:hypothetical protein IWZ03DRAFT_392252 [Phyllosticta citriasiana]|uniref:Translation initiation factor IF-2, mitochondrial n=2 Tax=Phyllosticta citriasiana TaxID=595635 RepID=A0ABR1KTH9_9PEZI
MPKRPAWRLPSEEPQRKSSRSSRFAQDEDEVDDGRRKRKDKKSFKAKKRQEREAKKAEAVDKPTPLYLPEYVTVSNFANMLKVRAEALLKKMEEFGYEDVRPDDILNAENAGLIASEYNFEPIPPLPEDMDLYPTPEPEDKSVLPLRPPVVTIMGHVDHGKTTLLDFLRKSSVVASEFGGITQHIGAFNVPLSSGKTITFLDTPGHAAFLNMRQRGANVTDIVILVVAADDGVKAQTEEAIKHAQSAGVPMIVAINKIDKEGAEIQRVKQDLTRHDIYVEDFGGDIQAIPVSGKTGQGMQDLEEATSLLSEILDHRADPTGPVEGHIIEASTKERGRVATLLIRRGTLKVGDIIVAGTTFARVRTMRNEAGVEVESVGPGMPAEIDGWRGQPEAGDEFLEAPNEQRANEAIEYRTVTRERIKLAKDMEAIAEARRQEHEKREKEARRQEQIAKAIKAKIENPEKYVADMEKAAEEGEEKKKREEVSLILKADVSGSEEACRDYIMTVGNNEVRPKIARSGVGTVSEFDIEFASAVKGYIVAFNVEIPQHIRRLASYHGVKFIENNVIYRLVDDIKKVLEERLPPLITHKITGELKILQEFDINIKGRKKVRVAGCRVENGMIERNSKVKVLRRNEVIYQGTLSSLKHEKRDVTEMRKDTECGLGFDGWSDFREGDTIQVYEEISNKRHL